MDNKDYWSDLVRECTEEFLRLSEEAERNVYDYVIPMLLEEQSPEQRDQFYHGVDWGKFKQDAPLLWAKESQDALNIQSRAAKKDMVPADALAQLRDQQRQEGFEFQRQVQSPTVFGLHTAPFRSAEDMGLNSPPPMGRFGAA